MFTAFNVTQEHIDAQLDHIARFHNMLLAECENPIQLLELAHENLWKDVLSVEKFMSSDPDEVHKNLAIFLFLRAFIEAFAPKDLQEFRLKMCKESFSLLNAVRQAAVAALTKSKE